MTQRKFAFSAGQTDESQTTRVRVKGQRAKRRSRINCSRPRLLLERDEAGLQGKIGRRVESKNHLLPKTKFPKTIPRVRPISFARIIINCDQLLHRAIRPEGCFSNARNDDGSFFGMIFQNGYEWKFILDGCGMENPWKNCDA